MRVFMLCSCRQKPRIKKQGRCRLEVIRDVKFHEEATKDRKTKDNRKRKLPISTGSTNQKESNMHTCFGTRHRGHSCFHSSAPHIFHHVSSEPSQDSQNATCPRGERSVNDIYESIFNWTWSQQQCKHSTFSIRKHNCLQYWPFSNGVDNARSYPKIAFSHFTSAKGEFWELRTCQESHPQFISYHHSINNYSKLS